MDDRALHASSVVANCAMNRERQLAGVNSYARELGFDPVEWLAALPGEGVGWLDLCCGSGRALLQAAERVRADAQLVGVDLVDAFLTQGGRPTLVAAPVESWTPDRRFDLITCVHGLHYVGDKLGVLGRVVSWLTPGGRFVADLDLDSVRVGDGRAAGRRLVAGLRAAGIDYDARRKRISCVGARELSLAYQYLGADDRAGPNYTGQPAVHSHYQPV
ncbi:ubiquinone biosynthesis methyltransferase UbiE [Actinoplanes awajinensis subsp. mycoplanecinus]|uniref:Ubiquinone biosynthesis methyltransferase UbiE n=1 Tax=Actinoplanes awajinensis subsp. mycoplanecinus TaxID=135947 RepID=A0A101J797_9ACTN|nr:ubiquinone biosynthesis methyltransferase UbiE [Actinoplanes awajinensis subsp. mycoplanecinus]